MQDNYPYGPSRIRQFLPYTAVLTVIAVLYCCWVFYDRWTVDRQIERAARARSEESNEKIVNMYGAGTLKILNFYASPGVIQRGDKTKLCFGVSNAVSVRIAPAVEEIKPSLSRCIEAAPTRTTTYTLTAEDKAGKSGMASATIHVR